MKNNLCENCGCKSYGGKCSNCHEELIISEQYQELDMPLPIRNGEFMQKVKQQEQEVKEILKNKTKF